MRLFKKNAPAWPPAWTYDAGAYIWRFVDGVPVQNRFDRNEDVPATSPASDALSRDLKQRGFKFVGSTIVYAHMQATGLVNDHVVGCFRYKPCQRLAKR